MAKNRDKTSQYKEFYTTWKEDDADLKSEVNISNECQ